MRVGPGWGDFEPDRLNPVASAMAEPVAAVTGFLLLLLFIRLLISLAPALTKLLKTAGRFAEIVFVLGIPAYAGFWTYFAAGLARSGASSGDRALLGLLAGLLILLLTLGAWMLFGFVQARAQSRRFVQEKSSTEEDELAYHKEKVRTMEEALQRLREIFSPVLLLRKIRQTLEHLVPRGLFPRTVQLDDGLYYSTHYGILLTATWVLAGAILVGTSMLNASMSEEEGWPIAAHEETMGHIDSWSKESTLNGVFDVFTVVDRRASIPRLQEWAFCRYELEVSEEQAALLLDGMDYALDRFWVTSLLEGVRGREVYVRSVKGETLKVKTAYNGGDGYVLTDGTKPLQNRVYLHPYCVSRG